LLRLSAAIRYLRWGTRQLSADFGGLGQVKSHPDTGDFLDRQMAATAAAAQHMRDLHRLVRDGIDHMPDATLLLDRQGRVLVASRSAQCHWETDAGGLMGRDTHELLADVRQRDTKAPMVPPGALLGAPTPILGEAEDARQRSLLMRCVPFFNAAGDHVGWMLSLVNITEMRRAQGQRDEALRFISHDIREPSASILTILELARARPGAHPPQAVFGRIERHAQTGLELADGFVNLARAEAQVFRAEHLDLIDLLRESIDNAWALASKREVRVVLSHSMETAHCFADHSLLMRAFSNVLSNALKYSPPGFDLLCSVSERGEHWAVGIQDHGPGIPIELQSQLFRPFHRLHRESHPEVHGIGLGLLLVRTVVQRHGGSIEIDSAVDAGCTVTLVLPKSKEAEPAALAAVHSE
jgi:signal transduction histidine kinase